MRHFEDRTGRRWDVVLGRESWGLYYAIFVLTDAGEGSLIRRAVLNAAGQDEATRELMGLDPDQLQELFLLSRSEAGGE